MSQIIQDLEDVLQGRQKPVEDLATQKLQVAQWRNSPMTKSQLMKLENRRKELVGKVMSCAKNQNPEATYAYALQLSELDETIQTLNK